MAALSRPRPQRRKRSWFNYGMALLAGVNLGLVAFDYSYIPWRDVYLRWLPGFTDWYGAQFKGIEPERSTDAYLQLVNQLAAQVSLEGLNTPKSRMLLMQLRQQSTAMIDENPFAVANKSGTLEQIKNRMRDRMGDDSAKQAFQQFWSPVYLQRVGWQQAYGFFNQDVRPLIATNYWRGIGENGLPIDRFWLIDIWFMGVFGLEFLGRTYFLNRRYPDTTWWDAMLWRLYDVPLFLPFWRWLRVIPVTLRLNQSGLVNLQPLRGKLNRVLISQVAIELTEVVCLRLLDQTQSLVREGRLRHWVFDDTGQRRYIDINGVNEVQTIVQLLSTTAVYQVLPQVKPEIDAVLSHSVESALSQAPAYQGLKFLPGFDTLSHQLTQQIASEVSKNLYLSLKRVLADEQGGELLAQLISRFSQHFATEIQQEGTIKKLQSLTLALLEEIKINYVERVEIADQAQLEEETYRIYSATQKVR
jgi:hypothetical protein